MLHSGGAGGADGSTNECKQYGCKARERQTHFDAIGSGEAKAGAHPHAAQQRCAG
jgi:hypothetical protein